MDIWATLVDLRYEEYCNSTSEFRSEFLKQPDPKLNEYALDGRIVLFQAIAFGLYRHLLRGKVRKDDPLYLHLQDYLSKVHKGHLKRI